MIPYLRNTVGRAKSAFSVLQKLNKKLVSPETKKNMRSMRIFIILGTLLLMGTPWVFGELIHSAINVDKPMVTALLAIVVSLVIVRIGVNLRMNLLFEKNHGDAYTYTDEVISNAFIKKNIKQLQTDKNLAIANINKAREFVNNIVGEINIGFVRVLTDLTVAYLATLIGSFVFHMGLIALTATLGLIVAFVYSAYLNTRVIEDTKEIEVDFRAYNRDTEETLEKLAAFKAQGMSRKLIKKNKKQHKKVFAEDRVFWYWYIKRSQLRELIISAFVIIAAYIIGVYYITVDPKSLPLVIALFSWGGIQAAALRELARLERRLNKRLPSIVSLFEALEMAPLREENGTRRFDKGERFNIEFEDVSHRYEDGKAVLLNISFTIKFGEKWAFVGESGSGKSTLVNLILGAMPPTEGEIYIMLQSTGEKIPLWDLDLDWWRSEVLGYVPQDVVLKDGTIRENLLLAIPEGQSTPTDGELLETLKKFNSIFRGYSKEEFLDVEVGRDGGVELSGGQRQRIGIVRAFLKNADLLIFDEATSSLDAETTNSVARAFKLLLSGNHTSITIAHDLSTLAGGDARKLISDKTCDNQLVCTHYLVLNPVVENQKFQQLDYAGSWEDLSESKVMRSLIKEFTKIDISN